MNVTLDTVDPWMNRLRLRDPHPDTLTQFHALLLMHGPYPRPDYFHGDEPWGVWNKRAKYRQKIERCVIKNKLLPNHHWSARKTFARVYTRAFIKWQKSG